jgi:hypothetical protein
MNLFLTKAIVNFFQRRSKSKATQKGKNSYQKSFGNSQETKYPTMVIK